MSTGCQKERKTDRKTDRKTERLFSLVIKTKVVQNVNSMSERFSDEGLTPKMIDYEKFLFTSTVQVGCQKDRKTGQQTDRRTDRQIDSQIFQLSYQNKSCSECEFTDHSAGSQLKIIAIFAYNLFSMSQGST